MRNKPIYFLDGTAASLSATRTRLPSEEAALSLSLQNSRWHKAENERASWVMLLSHLQSMERESQMWHQKYSRSGPPTTLPHVVFENHTLAVAIQTKTRSWDTVPANIKKPLATTTLCHLLEIAVMMGIHWKEFDRSKERYQAEGNGYMLTGSHILDFGLIFTFRIIGQNRFQENRVIPVDEVKDLCCGFVPTLFREDKDIHRLRLSKEKPMGLGFLQLGSIIDIAETMLSIGCNTDTANYFSSKNGKYSHLFPGKHTYDIQHKFIANYM
jgi:hypothetical protein